MKYPVLASRTLVLCLVLVATAQPESLARQSDGRIPFHVTTVSHDDADRGLLRESSDALRDALTAHGGEMSEQPRWVLLVGAMKVDQSEDALIALSVVAMHTLPEPAVQWARSAEIFYATVTDEVRADFPPEGKWVRESMSEDFIRQFAMVQDQLMRVVKRSDLRAGMDDIVASFYRRNVHVQ